MESRWEQKQGKPGRRLKQMFDDIKYHECAIWLGYTKHKGEVWGQKGRTSPRVRGDGVVEGSSGTMKCSKIDCGDASATSVLLHSCSVMSNSL